MKKESVTGIPAWKRGLLIGVIGLTAVGTAAGMRSRQMEQKSAMAMGDVSGKEDPATTKEKNITKQDKRIESTETKKIALTFDDGPHPRYTEELL